MAISHSFVFVFSSAYKLLRVGDTITFLMANRRYFFTWNNKDIADAHAEFEHAYGQGYINYACGQEEYAPTTGTQHIQGTI